MVMILMVILMIALMMMDQDIKKNKNKKREKKKQIDKIKKFSRLIHSRAHKNIVTHSQTSHSQTNVSI